MTVLLLPFMSKSMSIVVLFDYVSVSFLNVLFSYLFSINYLVSETDVILLSDQNLKLQSKGANMLTYNSAF